MNRDNGGKMFESRWNALRPELLSRSRRILGSHDDAEDAVQDAWIKMFRANPDLDADEDFRRYAYRAIATACQNIVASRRDDISLSDISEEIAYDEPGFIAVECECVAESMGSELAEVVRLDGMGFTQEEIADTIGISQPTVYRILSRARAILAA